MVEIIFSILVCILSTYLFGFIINFLFFSKLLKNQSSSIVFHSSIFTGFMSLTLLMALITTLGHTIFLVSLFPILLLLYRNFSIPSIDSIHFKKYFLESLQPVAFLFVCTLLSLLLLILKYDYFSEDTINLLWVDYGFYINVSEYFGSTSLEQATSWYSLYNNYNINELLFAPYHYGDIWIYRWISFFNFFEIMPIIYYGYVFLSLLAVFAYSSLVALSLVVFPKTNIIYVHLFSFFILFCVPFDYYLRSLGGHLLTLPKLFFFLVLLSYGVLFLYKNRYIESISLLCLIPLFHIFYAPAIYTSVFLMGFVILILNRKKRSTVKFDSIYSFLIPVFCTLFIIIFYKDFIFNFLQTSKAVTEQTSTNSESLIRIIWDIMKDHLWYWFAYLFVLITFITKKAIQTNKKIATLLFLVVFFQIVYYSILSKLKVPEANQIYMLLSSATPILLCFLVYSLRKYYTFIFSKAPFDLVFIFFFCCLSVFNYLSDKHGTEVGRNFVEELRKNTTTIENKQGIYYGHKESYPDHFPHFAGGVANLLKTVGDTYWAININYACPIYELKNCDKILSFGAKVPFEVIKDSPYYKFYEAKKDIITNETDLQLAFIEEMKVEFVIAVSLEEIPLQIREKAKTTIIDPKSKIAFLILK